MKSALAAAATAAALACTPALASIDAYTAFLYGVNEVPGPGDPDAFGVATVLIDNVADTVSWSIMVNNVTMPLIAAHIHTGAFGVAGPPIVDFSGSLTGSNLADTDLAMITPVNATAFYVNVHNADFPAGAARGQLQYVGTATPPVPEPASYGLMAAGLGVLGLLARRRRVQ